MLRRLSVPSVAWLAGAVALALYLATLAPDVTFVDSGELIVAAHGLGVAHPPGAPLYTLLAHAATWLPFGSVAVRVHVASAVFAALAVVAVALLSAAAVLGDTRPKDTPRPKATARPRGARRPERHAPADAGPDRVLLLSAALAAGLLFATSRTLWSYATIAEVYTLNICLLATALWLAVSWRRAHLSPPPADTRVRATRLYLAAACVGLALAVHHVTAVIVGIGVTLIVASAARRRPVPPAMLIRAAASAAAGLIVYAYLPLAASASPVLNWGDPRTLERFWWHISGRQYQVYFAGSLDTMAEQFRHTFVPYLAREFGRPWLPLALVLAAAGFTRLWTRDRTLAAAATAIIAIDLAYALNYDVAEDKDAYYLPAFLVLAMLAGVGAAHVLTFRQGRSPAVSWTLAALVLAAPATSLAGNLAYTNRRTYFLGGDYVRNVLGTVAPRGLLLTLDWQLYSPLLYKRHVEGLRPDVIAIDVNMLRRSWYVGYLMREYPAFMQAVGPPAGTFLDELIQWEHDPDLYQRDLARNRRINERFHGLITAFIEAQLRSGPVYITQDVLTQDRELAPLVTRYTLVPQGLVFQLRSEPGFHEPAEPALELRGLFDGSLRFAADDVVRVKVAPAYIAMLVNRGRYLAAHGHRERAAAVLQQALALDPSSAAARDSLAALR